MLTGEQLAPTLFAIFGGTGDLAWRKLIPALYDLCRDRSMPAHFAIIVLGRSPVSGDQLRDHLREGVNQFSRRGQVVAEEWAQFAGRIHYLQGDYQQLQTYTELGEQFLQLEEHWATKAQRIYYLATPPSLFGEISDRLGKTGLASDRQRSRIVLEKPIGYDLATARALNLKLAETFEESHIFRIDYYLARKRCRTSWPSALPIPFSSRSGTGAMWIMSPSPSPRK